MARKSRQPAAGGRPSAQETPARVRELVAKLASRSGTVPATAFGRLRRTARALLRGRSALSPGDDLDPAAVEELVRSFGELKGIAMKVGQILSYVDDALPAETGALLGVLRTWSPPTPFEAVAAIVRADLGDRGELLLAGLDRTPASSASIGQVHRGRLPSGEEVAVKVRHPGIEKAIRSDFQAAGMGSWLAQLLAPGAEVDSLIAEAKAAFLEECDYRLEARRQQRFAELYVDHPDITIPAVFHEWSSGGVLTMAWQEGESLEAFLARAPSAEARLRASRALYEFYVGTLYRHGVFNADPHPGNLLFQPEGILTILDHGSVREFDSPTVEAIAALSRAVRQDDEPAMRSALEALGAKDPGRSPAFAPTRALLRAFYAPLLEPGANRVSSGMPASMKELLSSKRSILKLRLPGKLLFLFRIRFGLYALLSRLGADIDLRALEEELADS